MKEIRKIIDVYEQIDWAKEKVALAAVVNVEESSYRRIGARMLVRSSGLWIGGISGGCLEGDALRRSQQAIFKGESSKVVYDTMEDDNNQIGVGLGCNGRIEVLFTPIDPEDAGNEIEQLKTITAAEAPSIMLKVIDAPDESGLLGQRSLLVNQQPPAEFCGISGSSLGIMITEVAGRRKPKVYTIDNGKYEVKLLVEFIRPETRMIIVGDNYDVGAMLGIGKELGWESFIVGRAKKLTREMFQQASKVVEYEEADSLPVNDYTAVLLMSHDYNWDKAVLPIFARKKPGYMGMLGPKKRYLKMRDDLVEINMDDIPFLYSPTGLEIGAESPNEIALSIAAEIVAIMRNKAGGSLKLKEGTIHERENV
jgi:xanthine/CO dehydrogenase XdhC/CoxF family maturation factor